MKTGWAATNFEYIEYLRKSIANETDPFREKMTLHTVMDAEAHRDYFSQSVKPISHLIQIDEKPNLEFQEPRWEIYKISVSFEAKGILFNHSMRSIDLSSIESTNKKNDF